VQQCSDTNKLMCPTPNVEGGALGMHADTNFALGAIGWTLPSGPAAAGTVTRSKPPTSAPAAHAVLLLCPTAGRQLPAGCWEEALAALQRVEAIMGARLGDAQNPLLLSVRSGAAVSAAPRCLTPPPQ
jgi:hypothetical protein